MSKVSNLCCEDIVKLYTGQICSVVEIRAGKETFVILKPNIANAVEFVENINAIFEIVTKAPEPDKRIPFILSVGDIVLMKRGTLIRVSKVNKVTFEGADLRKASHVSFKENIDHIYRIVEKAY